MLGVARIYQCHVSVHIIPRVSCAPVPLPIVLSCLMSPPPHKEKEKRKNACARSLREIRSSGWLGSLLWRKRASRRHQKKTKKKTTTTHPAASRTSHPHLHVHNRSNLRLKTEEKGRCGIFCVIVRCILVFFFTSSSPQMGGAVNLLHGRGLRFFMQPPLHHHHHHHHEPPVIKIPKPHHSPVRDWIKATRLLCRKCNHLSCIHAGDQTSLTFFLVTFTHRCF